MIVDCYTHFWDSVDQLGRCASPEQATAMDIPACAPGNPASPQKHLEAAKPVDTTIVIGFKSRYLEAEISYESVANYIKTHPQKMIGFAGIDPANPDEALDDMTAARKMGLLGIGLSPSSQNYHPSDTRVMNVYSKACELGMPIIFHTGIHMSRDCILEYARPILLDEIAREFPDLKIVIAHMGFPWLDETIALLAKHKNVFADVSNLIHRTWKAYQALQMATEYDVIDKLLFGSGFPHATASSCIESLYSINHLVHGTNLPVIPREKLRGIVERDTLDLLGIGSNSSRKPLSDENDVIPDDE